MESSKSNFKTIYFTFIIEIIAGIIILIFTYILSLNLTLFVILVIVLISVIILTYLGYIIYEKSKEESKLKDESDLKEEFELKETLEKNKKKRILDLDWKGAQPPEREKFMPWMDED